MNRGASHGWNLIIKLVLFTAVLSLVLLPMGNMTVDRPYTFGGVLWLSIALTVLAYIIGDLWVLPAYGNSAAVVVDAVLVMVGLAILPALLGLPAITFGRIIMAAVPLAVGEYFFHRHLQGQVPATAGLAGGMGEEQDGSGRPDDAPAPRS